jgi:putative membrane protein
MMRRHPLLAHRAGRMNVAAGRRPSGNLRSPHPPTPPLKPIRKPMNFLVSWLVLSLSVWITAMVLPGFHVKSLGKAVLVAAIFGILNALLGWLFFAIFTVATLGLAWLFSFITRWIINAILLKITDRLTTGLTIDGFRWALAGALMISVLGTVMEWLLLRAFS